MLLEDKWRLRKCCCFSLQTGSSIFGVLHIIDSILLMFIILSPSQFAQDVRNSVIMFPNTTAANAILCAAHIAQLALSSAMIYGNKHCKKHLMVPYVYMIVMSIIVFAIGQVIMMFQYFSHGAVGNGFGTLIGGVIGVAFWLWWCQVVRCRIVEIEEMERPTIPFTQVYPNAPPSYNEVKDNEVEGKEVKGNEE